MQTPSGTLEFDGQAYLDGRASDPAVLGWMEGTPPPPGKRVQFGVQPTLGFPQIRWSLCHMRELVPTVNVWRGDGGAREFPKALRTSDVEALRFQDMDGRARGWEESLHDTYTDGIVVLHRGRIVYERYLGILQPHLPHSCFSITKSYACTLAAALVHEGVLDETRTIPHWLPEMRGTAYGNATLRQVMDMQIGVKYSEAYADKSADIWAYSRAGSLLPRPAGYSGPGNFYEYLVTLQPEGAHGEAFAYKTVNTEVLCWVMKRATGVPFARMLSERLWSPLGCEQDAYITVDSIGVPMGGGGLSASLRDLARFGELMRRGGEWHGRQLLPQAVVDDVQRGSDPAKFAKAGYSLLAGYSYRSMWWVSHNELDAFEGRGIHGQRLYVAPGAEMVVARFGSHPVASSAANDPITLPQLLALGRMLKG
ncbi:serine hydrolase domain-containing protein [Ramlibacter humi]|uniref:Class C beta-lactamase-related serine hydrolase n=1 Tax=Ramlibacter humi TaxID=2530451 RepID=A0A4Z0BYR9_9BURK|nr:serine hydrolase [Ramlibacter humi]TFZ03674.1 class C beta-lactamase-related serine hydrolase [Ramlibacter humi]